MPRVKSGHMQQIATYENCKIAIHDTLKGKTKSRRAKKIRSSIPRTAWRLKTVLESGTYKAHKMREFYVRDGAKRKVRHITIPDLHSQFVHHAVFNVIGKTIEKRNYFYDCGNMSGKGCRLAIKRTKRLFADKKNKYYAQVRRIEILRQHPAQAADMDATKPHHERQTDASPLWEIIKSSGKQGRGLAIGFYSSQYLAVLYLQGLDYKITQEFAPGCGYVRYVDDGIIVGGNRRVLERALYLIENYLRTIGLRIKGVWKVRKIKERLAPFLGMRFGRGYVIMGKHIMYRISRAARYAAGRKLTQHRASQLLSYWGH